MALCSSSDTSEVALGAGEGSRQLGGAVATAAVQHGAPAGIAQHIPPARLFPQVSDAPLALEEEVVGQSVKNHLSFLQTHGAEQSLGEEQIADLVRRGFVELFPTVPAAEAEVGGPLVLSPLGNVRKEREGRVKNRVITDLRQANRLARRSERVVPRRGSRVGRRLVLH
eukprot:3453669-Amphidinium_carterae.1